jgi:hypothetical protein
MNLLRSLGLKRLVASWLSAVVEVLRAIPGTSEWISTIEVTAGVFGVTGLGHSGAAGTLSKKKLATASAAVAALIALSHVIPALAVARPFLEKVAAVLGSAAVTAQFVGK